MRRSISRQVATVAAVPVVSAERVDAALASLGECRDEQRRSSIPCATRLGRRLKTSHVVVGAVGGLSGTYVVRLKVVTVGRSAVTRTVEKTLLGAPDRLDAALAGMTKQLFDVPEPVPWYKRWWLWALVGVGVSAAVAIPIIVQDRDPYEDLPVP